MTIDLLEAGRRAVVCAVHGGHARRGHLMNLGIVPGVPVKVVKAERRGPMILEVMGAQIMLGHGMANAIEVR